MYYAILTSGDNRLSSYMQIEPGVGTVMNFDDSSNYRVVTVSDEVAAEIDVAKDLGDHVFDDETGTFVYDPVDDPSEIQYADLESGNTVTMTQEEFDALIDEKTRNNVEAIIQEMIEANTFTLNGATSPLDVVNGTIQ